MCTLRVAVLPVPLLTSGWELGMMAGKDVLATGCSGARPSNRLGCVDSGAVGTAPGPTGSADPEITHHAALCYTQHSK